MPIIKKGSDYMNAITYTGNGSTQTINVGFQPDLVWIKSRSAATDNKLTDSVRGAMVGLISNSTGAETTDTTGVTAFTSTGFTLGASSTYNNNGATYVAWCWKKGATPGFDIVTYTGTGSGSATVAHSLGVAPKLIFVKKRNAVSPWYAQHASVGAGYVAYLNTTDAFGASSAWNSTAPTASVFSVASSLNDANTFVAYLFAEIAGFSKFGSYTGNGSADGSFVYLGFQPSFIMVKMSSSTGNWTILDNKRLGYNVDNNPLYPNLSNAEGTTDLIDITSNGFKIRATDASVNTNGGTYIYAAFAENPFKYANAR